MIQNILPHTKNTLLGLTLKNQTTLDNFLTLVVESSQVTDFLAEMMPTLISKTAIKKFAGFF